MGIPKLHVYILHCKALKERDASVQNIVSKLQSEPMKNADLVDIAVVGSHDPSDIPLDVIQKSIEYSPIQEDGLVKYNQFVKNIHINQLSNVFKHIDALKKIAACPNDGDLHIVMEDDTLFNDDVCRSIDTLVGMIRHEQIVFTGLPSNEPSMAIKPTREVFGGLVPLCDSYIITKRAAKAICDAIFPIRMVWNMHLNYILEKIGIVPYHSSKGIFVNGSKYGMFVSTLSPNNTLIFNRDYMLVAERLNKPLLTPEDEAFIAKTAQDTPIAKSPDFQYLMARYHSKKKDYKAAEECFKASFHTTLANNGVINHESTMLKEYISMHKHMQVF